MTEHFVLWVTTDFGRFEPPTIKTLRRRLTKMAKLVPDDAVVTVTTRTTDSGSTYTQVAARRDRFA